MSVPPKTDRKPAAYVAPIPSPGDNPPSPEGRHLIRLKQLADVTELTAGPPYVGYAYSYPHKTAYRPLRPPVLVRDAWAGEPKDSLFLYLHVPFCEMRCGF